MEPLVSCWQVEDASSSEAPAISLSPKKSLWPLLSMCLSLWQAVHISFQGP